jgi:hypothetical protein
MKTLKRIRLLAAIAISIGLFSILFTQAGISTKAAPASNQAASLANEDLWLQVPSPTQETLHDVAVVSANDAWAVGENQTILRWDGLAWTAFADPLGNSWYGIDMVTADDGWIVGDFGALLRWNGASWQSQVLPTTRALRSIDMISATDGWAVGDESLIIHWDGSQWTPVPNLPFDPDIYDVSMVSATEGWAVGDSINGLVILRWDGVSWFIWASQFQYPHNQLYSVDMWSADSGLIGGFAGTTLAWDGTTWTWKDSHTFQEIYGVSMAAATDGWGVGWEPTHVFHWDGSEWTAVPRTAVGPLRAVSMLSPETGWAVGDDGLILHYHVEIQDLPSWDNVGAGGLGNPANTFISTLQVWGDSLFAGASNWAEGGSVYRFNEANATWIPQSEPGFSGVHANSNGAIIDMAVFNDHLYASTGWSGQPGQLWRTANGTTWTPITIDGFGNSANTGLAAFGEFSGYLYLATTNETEGLEIWRSQTGDSSDWTQVLADGGDTANNHIATSFLEFNDDFYVSFENDDEGMGVWRTSNGTDWDQVNAPGFGDANNTLAGGLGIHNGFLYIGTRNDTTGGQLWRSSSGTDWEQGVGDGFGDPNNIKIDAAVSFQDALHVSTENQVTGVEIWRSSDGDAWEQVNEDGFGDAHNANILWSSGTAIFKGNFYAGTSNWSSGGEVWKLATTYSLYLPLITR